jgi:hypothetical protein
MLRHVRLAEEDAALGIETTGEEVDRGVARELPQGPGIANARERVQVHQNRQDLPAILEADERPHRPEVVSQMESARRLDAGQDPRHGVRVSSPRPSGPLP